MTGVQPVDWAALSPVVVPALAVVVLLLVEAVRPGLSRLLDALALAALVGSAAAVAAVGTDRRGTFCVSSGGVSACSYEVGPLTASLQVVVLAGALTTLLLALGNPGARPRAEHHVLLLAATTGALALAGARDLATLVVALETASLPVAALAALPRSAVAAQAAVKLLLVQVASLALLAMGVALLYTGTGALHLSLVAAADVPGGAVPVVALGAALAVAGVAFKLSAAPFGFWTPDVYAGVPVPVAAFLSTVSKAAGLAALLLVVVVALPGQVGVWAPLLAVLAAVTMTVGNLVALRQDRAVRLLAWSAVAQAGWVLLPLAGAADDLAAASGAALTYLLAYVLATLAAFTVVATVARRHVDGSGHDLDAYRGLARRQPLPALVLALALACLAGLPPGVMGLVAKLVALRPVVADAGWVLAVVAALNVALALAYYLRWAALLVTPPLGGPPLGGPPLGGPPLGGPAAAGSRAPAWRLTRAEVVAVTATGAACLVASLAPQVLLVVAGNAGR